MHILWKLKSVRKEVMAEITEEPHYNTLSTIVRLEDTLPITPTEKNASILPHHCYRGLQKRVYEYGN
jgi:hypothetical protein